MFTPKLSSKLKHMKTTQEHETENAVRGSSRESSIFHPKTQSLISKHPNSFQKFAYKFIYIQDTLKLCRTCNNSALILIIIHDPSNFINDPSNSINDPNDSNNHTGWELVIFIFIPYVSILELCCGAFLLLFEQCC